MSDEIHPQDPPPSVELPARTHHEVHDPTTGKFSVTVVEALAEAVGADATEVAVPVFERIDPDGLDAIFADRPDGTPRTGAHVAFGVWGLRVVAHADGHIYVHPPDD